MDEDEALKTVDLLVFLACEKLKDAAELLRGEHVEASPPSMRLEIAVSRALDALTAARKA